MDVEKLTFMDGVRLSSSLILGLIKKQQDVYAADLEIVVREMFDAITNDYNSNRIESMKDHFNVKSNFEYKFLRETFDPILAVETKN